MSTLTLLGMGVQDYSKVQRGVESGSPYICFVYLVHDVNEPRYHRERNEENIGVNGRLSINYGRWR